MTRNEIKHQFIADSAEHGKAHFIGDYKKANKLHKKLHELYYCAKEQNQADVFSELLNDEDENVRIWAATFTLKVFPVLAEKTLQEIDHSSNINGIDAKTTLRLWKEGKLELFKRI